MRLFLAIDLPHEIRLRLDRLLAVLRPEALIKWSPLDNLHITTKFIGEWPDVRLNELHEALLQLAPRTPLQIELRDLGWFPNRRLPRVFWAGVCGGEPLAALARETEECLTPLGIKREARRFSPHLTLARIKSPVPLSRFQEKIDAMQPVVIGSFSACNFQLYRSDPGSSSSIYRILREYKFEDAMAASGSQL